MTIGYIDETQNFFVDQRNLGNQLRALETLLIEYKLFSIEQLDDMTPAEVIAAIIPLVTMLAQIKGGSPNQMIKGWHDLLRWAAQ